MITLEEKEKMWQDVLKEFPSDPMLRDLHFIRELMSVIRNRVKKVTNYKEIGLIARKEFAEWLKVHPELNRQEPPILRNAREQDRTRSENQRDKIPELLPLKNMDNGSSCYQQARPNLRSSRSRSPN
jgi:hypothetical protein